jgi:hypothetical protein
MCPIVSANWNNSSNAGVWALNLNNVRSNANNNVGGRADSGSLRIRQRKGGTKGGAFWRSGQPGAKSIFIRSSGRAMRLEGRAA